MNVTNLPSPAGRNYDSHTGTVKGPSGALWIPSQEGEWFLGQLEPEDRAGGAITLAALDDADELWGRWHAPD
jgi:hypothetical protein